MLSAEGSASVCVLKDWGADEMAKVEGKAKLLPLMMGTALTLTECKGDWWRGFCSQSPENVGWCPQNKQICHMGSLQAFPRGA